MLVVIYRNIVSYYRLHTEYEEGNVFTSVCLFTGGSAFTQCHGNADTPPGKPPRYGQPGGWYVSYWNAYLSSICIWNCLFLVVSVVSRPFLVFNLFKNIICLNEKSLRGKHTCTRVTNTFSSIKVM